MGRTMTIARAAVALLALGTLAGARPASAAGTGRIFVSSERDHSVTVLDGKTLEKVAVVKTGNRARHLRFSADRKLLYVAASDSNRVDIIDVATLEGRRPRGRRPGSRGVRPLAGRQDDVRGQRGRRGAVVLRHGDPEEGRQREGRRGARGRAGASERQDRLRHLRGGAHGARDRYRDAQADGEHPRGGPAAPPRADPRSQGALGHQRDRRHGEHHRHRGEQDHRRDQVRAEGLPARTRSRRWASP